MTKKSILIVENETMTSLCEKQMLENLSYEVTGIALSGEVAVQMAGVDKPDLVLMDIVLMGDMDGREACPSQKLHLGADHADLLPSRERGRADSMAG